MASSPGGFIQEEMGPKEHEPGRTKDTQNNQGKKLLLLFSGRIEDFRPNRVADPFADPRSKTSTKNQKH